MKQMHKKAEKHSSPLLKKLMAERDPAQTARTRNRMLLAAKIDDALKAKGWRKKNLAEALNQQPSVITKWLSGTHNFTGDTLTDIGAALNIKLLNTEEKPKEIVEHFKTIIVTQTSEKQPLDISPVFGQSSFQLWAQVSTRSSTHTN